MKIDVLNSDTLNHDETRVLYLLDRAGKGSIREISMTVFGCYRGRKHTHERNDLGVRNALRRLVEHQLRERPHESVKPVRRCAACCAAASSAIRSRGCATSVRRGSRSPEISRNRQAELARERREAPPAFRAGRVASSAGSPGRRRRRWRSWD